MHLSISAAAVLAAMLALTALVSAPDIERRILEYFDNSLIQNLDQSEMGPEKALALIDRLCNQTVDLQGQVSGAINFGTWDFLTWEQYRTGPGQGQELNPWYAAHGDWMTFRGACFFQQYSTWNQNSETSESTHYRNTQLYASWRSTITKVYIPGFSAETNLPSRVVPVQNRMTAFRIFENLYGLPARIVNAWVGLSENLVEPSMIRKVVGVDIPRCSEFWWTATTVERYVRVQWVFQVDWFYYNSNGVSGAVENWLGRGYEWKYVTSSGAWIDGHGVTKQTPAEDPYTLKPTLVSLPPDQCKPPRVRGREL
jgi:hypothetical protein